MSNFISEPTLQGIRNTLALSGGLSKNHIVRACSYSCSNNIREKSVTFTITLVQPKKKQRKPPASSRVTNAQEVKEKDQPPRQTNTVGTTFHHPSSSQVTSSQEIKSPAFHQPQGTTGFSKKPGFHKNLKDVFAKKTPSKSYASAVASSNSPSTTHSPPKDKGLGTVPTPTPEDVKVSDQDPVDDRKRPPKRKDQASPIKPDDVPSQSRPASPQYRWRLHYPSVYNMLANKWTALAKRDVPARLVLPLSTLASAISATSDQPGELYEKAVGILKRMQVMEKDAHFRRLTLFPSDFTFGTEQ